MDVADLDIKVDKAMEDFIKNWKTLDLEKINYLMKYGLVQEVMKVEERKAVRREAAEKKALLDQLKASKPKKVAEAPPEEQQQPDSPRVKERKASQDYDFSPPKPIATTVKT